MCKPQVDRTERTALFPPRHCSFPPCLMDRRRTATFLLHGLGAHPATLWPLKAYLTWWLRVRNVHAIHYDVNTPTVELSAASACRAMDAVLGCTSVAERQQWDVVLIGHSWGGLVSNRLHLAGWRIRGGVYVASPLHGARMLASIRDTLPTAWFRKLARPSYAPLLTKAKEELPPHPVHTISCGYFLSSFDGCVYRDEATLDEKRHTHLVNHDHRAVIISPRLFGVIGQCMQRFFHEGAI